MKLSRCIAAEFKRGVHPAALLLPVLVYLALLYLALHVGGAWECFPTQGSEALGFFPNPYFMLLPGADLVPLAPLAYAMVFPAVAVFSLGKLMPTPLGGPECTVSAARGSGYATLLAARCVAAIVYVLGPFALFCGLVACGMPWLFEVEVSVSQWLELACRGALMLVVGASYVVVVVSAISAFGATDAVLGVLLFVAYLSQVMSEFSGILIPGHASLFMLTCGSIALDASRVALIVGFSVGSALVAVCACTLLWRRVLALR